MDDLCVGGEAVEAAGDPVVEAGAEGDQQVGLLHGGDSREVAVHAGHAEAQLVAVGKGTPGHERGDDVDAGHLGELSQHLAGSGLEDSAAHVEDGALSRPDQVGGDGYARRVDPGGRVVAREVHLDVVGPLHRRAGVVGIDDVLGDVDEHRPRTAGRGDVERLLDDPGDVLCLGDEEVVLGDRHGDAGGVALLEGVRADGGVRHLTGDADQWHRVEVGVAEGGDDVGGGGSAGDHGAAGPAGGVRIAGCHVAGALLVADQDVADRRVDERVVDREDRPAGQAEQQVDALVLESPDQRLAAVHGFRRHVSC